MAFTTQQAVPFGQRLLLRFSPPARRRWRRAFLRPIGSAEGTGPRALCLRGLAASAVASSPMGGFHGVYQGLVAARHWLGGRSGAEWSGGERSGGLLGMTHAPEVRGHCGSVGVCIGGSQWVLCECGQLRRRRAPMIPAVPMSANAPGAGTTVR